MTHRTPFFFKIIDLGKNHLTQKAKISSSDELYFVFDKL